MAKIIGITGNIGCGKTAVSNFFRMLDFPVFNADIASKSILNHNPEVKNTIVHKFGADFKTPEGNIDRKKLAEIAFNPEHILFLNNLLHPLVKSLFSKWLQQQSASFVFRESALLFETGIAKESLLNITVTCPLAERIKRVTLRDNIPEEQILKREHLQWAEEKKVKQSDLVINNYNTALLPQLIAATRTINSYL